MDKIIQQKQEIINHLNLIPQNRLNEVNLFMRFIIYETQQISKNDNTDNEYSNLDFLSPQQNSELKNRLQKLETDEMNFIGLSEFKQKYKHYVHA